MIRPQEILDRYGFIPLGARGPIELNGVYRVEGSIVEDFDVVPIAELDEAEFRRIEAECGARPLGPEFAHFYKVIVE